MTAPQEIEWEACLIEPRPDPALERWAAREMGRSLPGLCYFSAVPWLARMTVGLRTAPLLHADRRLVDLAALVVSRDNACRYCYAGIRVLLRILDIPDAQIDRLEENLLTAELDERERRGLDFARRLSRANPPPGREELKSLCEAGYSEGEIHELAFVTAAYVAINRVTTFAALPPYQMERMRKSWLLPLARLFIGRALARYYPAGHPQSLPDELKSGPFSAVPRALDGLPVAVHLGRVLQESFASAALEPRTRVLVFAVVARGLGCSSVEREAVELLLDADLKPDQVEQVLAHLASPALDEIESVIVPFARETIWYQPASIQRRGRDVQATLGTERFLELIGTAALANAVCRLSFVLSEG